MIRAYIYIDTDIAISLPRLMKALLLSGYGTHIKNQLCSRALGRLRERHAVVHLPVDGLELPAVTTRIK